MKGFVFIYGSEVILRFWASGAFKALEACHDLTYVVLRSEEQLTEALLSEFTTLNRQRVKWVNYYPERFRRWQELFNASCILYEDKSPSFAVRNQEMFQSESNRRARLENLARPGIYEKHRDKMERYMGLHPDILTLTLHERPDFFVLPSALLDYIADDVLQIVEKLAIPTLFLVSGWDNLSSKGLLYHQPTMMGVWGEQSKRRKWITLLSLALYQPCM